MNPTTESKLPPNFGKNDLSKMARELIENDYNRGFDAGVQAACEYLPFDKAPKDGTKILAVGPKWNCAAVIYWDECIKTLDDGTQLESYSWWFADPIYDLEAIGMTHFMYLPQLPLEKDKQNDGFL